MTSERMLSVADLADKLAVPIGHIYRMAADGRIPSIKIGKYRRFDLDQVLKALDRQQNGGN